MRVRIIILLFVACLFAACSSTKKVPLDDAYYWPDYEGQYVEQRESVAPEESAPTLEILHEQDTTITVRIHR